VDTGTEDSEELEDNDSWVKAPLSPKELGMQTIKDAYGIL
jgi:hypothetical protein